MSKIAIYRFHDVLPARASQKEGSWKLPIVILALVGLFVVIDLAVFRVGVKLFRREEILSKLA